jgi:hypothetical protein
MHDTTRGDEHSADRGPFVGPRPFIEDERALFFGRDWEAQELTSVILSRDVVVVCGPSGAGKTSLINARIVPDLIESGAQVLPRVRVGGPWGLPRVGTRGRI